MFNPDWGRMKAHSPYPLWSLLCRSLSARRATPGTAPGPYQPSSARAAGEPTLSPGRVNRLASGKSGRVTRTDGLITGQRGTTLQGTLNGHGKSTRNKERGRGPAGETRECDDARIRALLG